MALINCPDCNNPVSDSAVQCPKCGYPPAAARILSSVHDANGNMISQLDKNISSIQYNFLNLPNQVMQSGGNTGYVYRADGLKVKKTYGTKVTDYLDGFQYENSTLQFVPTAEGYYDFANSRYTYNYVDHLGNVRISYYKNSTGVLTTLEESNYYPFGLKHEGYNSLTGNPAYKYSYQGQEKQETGFLSFKWREYMADLGRFIQIDPLASKYPYNTPYAIQENKLGLGIELEGLELVRRGTGMFEQKVNGSRTTISTINYNVPSSQKDIHGNVVFTPGGIGLTLKGYNPNQLSFSGSGFAKASTNAEAPEDLQMQDAPGDPTKPVEPQERGTTLLDGVKTLFDLGVKAKDIITGKIFEDNSNYVKAVNERVATENQAKKFGYAEIIVNKSLPKNADPNFKANVINYVFSGQLPNASIMITTPIIKVGNTILNANNIPIQNQPKPEPKKPAPLP